MTETLLLHSIQLILLIAMISISLYLIYYITKHRINPLKRFFTGLWIGFITDALDTVGIGSFATSTTLFKLTKLIDDDRKLPATMTVVHVLPVLLQSLCFILVVRVEPLTLIAMASAAFIGAFFGSRITKKWHAPTVQRILGGLLIIAALFMAFRMITNPGADITNSAHGLHGVWLFIGIIFNFITGILMTMGLGNYAPELIFFSLMGLSPTVAMPVMMLDAAMIMTASSSQFIKSGRVNWEGFLGLVVGGILGVIVAVLFLTNLNLNSLKLLVIFIVIFTGCMLIRSSFKETIGTNHHKH
ncbi:sulfite exporter TauE/SafE family protein [Streptococcus sciuri]|uniref:Probable membrane transporter protein n=1 Tax=Streptococcus sciuri TaxID=2973939 RepID=A0ABT2F6X2_9STRE|nr:sulfite exporter TauE/SafE family protein [Streptococcus sciuri]MCS4488245.1 sulfite exporter TauE/SafE family protein [Streptococcus sciuri]